MTVLRPLLHSLSVIATVAVTASTYGQHVTFAPYIQLGDNGPFGASDQIVIAWQTDETSPAASTYKVVYRGGDAQNQSVTPKARVIDNYLSADPSLPTIPTAYGAHSNYTAVL